VSPSNRHRIASTRLHPTNSIDRRKALLPAAQYVRMSTDDQKFSIENQKTAIQLYADRHGFTILQTYADVGKSGLVLQHRPGLIQLLHDVIGGVAEYQAILVYDVSRWGRFQDADESAYYEFICKSSGMPVHYCAESFESTNCLHDSLLKSLKRTMAAEFSRELGVKVLEGRKRIAQLGFSVGGPAGYGYRRLLLSAEGKPRKILQNGERKYATRERVRLVLGPKRECSCVRKIFTMYVAGKSMKQITRWLNKKGISFTGRSRWKSSTVKNILSNPKYIGNNVLGRVSRRLHQPASAVDPAQWVVKPNAFPAIVRKRVFERAQIVLRERGRQPTDSECIARVKKILARKGKLTMEIIQDVHKRYGLPAAPNLGLRFGSYHRLYQLAGYRPPTRWIVGASHAQQTRMGLLSLAERIRAMFPTHVTLYTVAPNKRAILRIDDRLSLSLIACTARQTSNGSLIWRFRPRREENKNITLLCTLTLDRTAFQYFYLVPDVRRNAVYSCTIHENDPWFASGNRVTDLSKLYERVLQVDLEIYGPR
jgi:DNA invertase Pin-like site-specific DNA recombinase